MWPVTFGLPRYKETFLITYVDKYFAYAEKNIGKNVQFEGGKIYEEIKL